MPENLVILHGWGSDLSRWQPVVKLFRQAGVKVLLPKLPMTNPKMRVSDFSSWLAAYTNKLKHFSLLGHSFGGQVAINFASQYPQKLHKLILVNSAGIRSRHSLKRALLYIPAKIGKTFLAQFPKLRKAFYKLIGSSDYDKANQIEKQILATIVKEDQRQNMTKIHTPTLIFWGGQDNYTPLWQGNLTHKLISGSKLNIYLKAKHSLPFTHTLQLIKDSLWFIGLK